MRIVIKLGGELLAPERAEELSAILTDVRSLIEAGHQVVFVHGGGPQTTAMMRTLSMEPTIVAGRRVTDEAALDVLKMVVGGRLNIELVSRLRGHQVMAIGLNGVSGGLIRCKKRPPKIVVGGPDTPVDFGWVGDILEVKVSLLQLLLQDGYTPVLACIASDDQGLAYNVNADVVANHVAVGFAAERLFLITSAPGVLKDINDPNSRIPKLTVEQGEAAIVEGVVQGGMIPKLQEAFGAIQKGVKEIHILGRLQPGDLAKAAAEPGSVGTALVTSP